MTFIILIGVFVGVFFIVYLYNNNKSKLKNVKQIPAKIPDKTQVKSQVKKTEPLVKQETISKGKTANKVIICHDCIVEYENRPTQPTEENPDLITDASNVLVFSNWIPYAAHIFKAHPNSTRVQWAIDCVKDETLECDRQNKPYPEYLKTLIKLIQTHGQEPADIDVGEPYTKVDKLAHPEAIDANKQRIQVVDDWTERLGEIGIKTEQKVDTEKPKDTIKPPDYFENMS
jgi:hypothetical protein